MIFFPLSLCLTDSPNLPYHQLHFLSLFIKKETKKKNKKENPLKNTKTKKKCTKMLKPVLRRTILFSNKSMDAKGRQGCVFSG